MKINFDNISTLDFQSSEAYKTLRTNIQFCGEEIKSSQLHQLPAK